MNIGDIVRVCASENCFGIKKPYTFLGKLVSNYPLHIVMHGNYEYFGAFREELEAVSDEEAMLYKLENV